MIPDSARRKAPPRSAALRPASSLSNPSSSSSSRSPSPPIKVPNALLLGGGTYNGNPQASSNLQLLAAASGLLSTTPDTLETVKGELLDRQQLGGLPLLFKDLARLGRLSLSNEEGEEGKMKIDKELGEPQIENSSDEEMLKARERIRDDGSDLSDSGSASPHPQSQQAPIQPQQAPPPPPQTQDLPAFVAGLMNYQQCVDYVKAQGGKAGEGELQPYGPGELNSTLESYSDQFWKFEDGFPDIPDSIKREVCAKVKILADILRKGERPAAYKAGLLPLQVFFSQFVTVWHPIRGPEPGKSRKGSNNIILCWDFVRSLGADPVDVDRLESEEWRESTTVIKGWSESLKAKYGNFLSLFSFACASASRCPSLVGYKSLRGGTGTSLEIMERIFLTSDEFKPVRDLLIGQLRTAILRLCATNPGSLPLDYNWYIDYDTQGYSDLIINAANQRPEFNNTSRVSGSGGFPSSTLAVRWGTSQKKLLDTELAKLDGEVRNGLTGVAGEFTGVTFEGTYKRQVDRTKVSRSSAQRQAQFVVRLQTLNDLCQTRTPEITHVKCRDGSVVDVTTPHNSAAASVRKEVEDYLIDNLFQPIISHLLPLSTADPYVPFESRTSDRPKPRKSIIHEGVRTAGNSSGVTLHGRRAVEGFIKIDNKSVPQDQLEVAMVDDRGEEEQSEDVEGRSGTNDTLWDPFKDLEDIVDDFKAQPIVNLENAKPLFKALEVYGVEWQDIAPQVGTSWAPKLVLENRQTIRIVLSTYVDLGVIPLDLARRLFRLYDVLLVAAAKLESPVLFTLAPDMLYRRILAEGRVETVDVHLLGLVVSETLSRVRVSMTSMTFWSDSIFINYPVESRIKHSTLRDRFFDAVGSSQGLSCSREGCLDLLDPNLPVKQTKEFADSPAYSCKISRQGYLRQLATDEMVLPAGKATRFWPIGPCPSGLVMTTVSWATLFSVIGITKVEHSRCKNSRDRQAWHQTWRINGQDTQVKVEEDFQAVDEQPPVEGNKRRRVEKDEGDSEEEEGNDEKDQDEEA